MQERDNFYDCIRALAATLVFLTHAGILSGGSIGVSIFFCLSGFLITRILLRLPELSIINATKFIFRRFMRVWPMMMFQILLTVATVAWLYPDYLASYARDILKMGTFTGGYSTFVEGAASPLLLWTLRAEFWFYVFYPLVLMIVGRDRLPWIAGAAIILSWYLKFSIGHAGRGLGPFNYTFIYLDQLMYGALCSYVIERKSDVARVIFRYRTIAVWLPFVGILVLSTLGFKGYDWTWYAETSAAAILTAPMMLHQWARPLRGDYEPIATIGRISYSIYLLHYMVLEHLFPHAFPTVLEFFLRCGGVICFSLLTYHFIELPFIALSKRITECSSVSASSIVR